MNENPFSLVCEKSVIREGTVNRIVREDLSRIRKLFLYDFSGVERELGIDCFSLLSDYQAVKKDLPVPEGPRMKAL